MAEKVTLFELDIDLDQAVKAQKAQMEAVEELKKSIDELKESEDDNTEAIIKKNAELKVAQKQLRENQKFTQELIQAEQANAGSIEQLRRELSAVTIEWKNLSEEERLNTERGKQLAAQKLELTERLKEEEKATGDTRRNVGNYADDILKAVEALEKQKRAQMKQIDELQEARKATAKGSIEQKKYDLAIIQTQKDLAKTTQELDKYQDEQEEAGEGLKDVADKFGLFGGAAGQAAGSLKGLGLGVKAALGPLALIIGAIAAIVKAFKRNEKAMESLNKVFAIFRGVIDGLLNALQPLVEDIGDKLLSFFENPIESIKNLGNALKQNFINRIEGLLELLPALGRSVQLLFKGEFAEAGKVAADAVGKVVLGVEDVTDKVGDAIENVKEFGATVVDEANKAIDANKRLANSERELLRIQKAFELQQLTFQKLAEDQRQIRDDESKNIQDRIAANEELGRVLDEQLQKEIELASKQLEFAELRRIADGNTLEVEEQILDAQIKIAEITERIDAQRSEQLTNRNALLKEQREKEEEAQKVEAERLRKVAEQAAKTFEESLINRNKIQSEYNEQQLKNQNDLAAKRLELGLINQEEYNKQLSENQKEFDEAEAERQLAVQETDFQNRLEAEQNNLSAQLDLEREYLEQKRIQDVEFAESIGADVEAVNAKYTAANIQLAKAERDAKLAIIGGVAQNVAQLFGEQTAIGKAAAIAQTAITTYQGATQAFTAASIFPPPAGQIIGAAAAGVIIANGLANVKKILSVDSGLPGDSPGGGGASISSASGGGGGGFTNINPQLGQGIVSRGDISGRNIAETIENQDLQPVLVEDDVTQKQNQSSENSATAVI